MPDRIRILLVDDHDLVRGMLAGRLEREPDMTVVGGVATADEALGLAVTAQPDVVLMDVDMPGMLCFDAAREVRRRCPVTRVVFLSAFFHDRYIAQALDVQAWGYVTKSEPEESLVRAVRKVAAGVAYFSPEVQARMVLDSHGPRLARAGCTRAATLSAREVEVLRYLARGMSKKEIGSTLHLSANTVNRHATSLMTKLDIHDRVELARYAIREGLAEA